MQTQLDWSAADIEQLLEIPPDPAYGDIAFPCFALANTWRQPPHEIAQQLAKHLHAQHNNYIQAITAAGPYLNFTLNAAALAQELWYATVEYGRSFAEQPAQDEVVVIEFPGPNTNKPLHVGHLRNMALGEATARLLESQGYTVKRVNINNDRGIHICKSMLAYQLWGNGQQPDRKPDHFVGNYYVLFSQKAQEQPELEEKAKELLRRWEAGDQEVQQLWQHMNQWALDGFQQTYRRFGVSHDTEYYESDTYQGGKELVQQGLEDGVLYQDADGAIRADLGEELGNKVVLRADGTSLYITQDLHLAQQKYEDFHYDRSIYVVAREQNHHFQVLFRLLTLLGMPAAHGCYHLSYGMVNLPSGRMKSREGTVVDADDLMDTVVGLAQDAIQDRGIATDDHDTVAEQIGIAAIRYMLLNHRPHKDMVFDPDASVSFEGDTGPYLQYALVRARRIVEKSELTADMGVLQEHQFNAAEHALIVHMAKLQQVLRAAAEQYDPHQLIQYTRQLAVLFNGFYEQCPVLQETASVQAARLAIVELFCTTMAACLANLGIADISAM